MYKRTQTNKVMVGNVQVGHQNKIVIQSMTNTKTSDVSHTLEQINLLYKNGCELVRVAVLDKEDLDALKTICKKAPCPIVADIHFIDEYAIQAIKNGVAKVRINPGNLSLDKLKEVVLTAKQYDCAIRIGINQGSLWKNKKLNSVKEIINLAKKYISQFKKWGFHKIIVSLKSSNPNFAAQLYLAASKTIKYPLHIGVTEAGTKIDSIIKTCIGLSQIISQGIGDTIRVSITGKPDDEPYIAKKILAQFNLYDNIPNIVSCPTCGRLQWDLTKLINQVEDYIKNINKKITIAIMGCSVNGIGECLKSDIGVYGNKSKNVIYFKHKLYKIVNANKSFNIIKGLIDKVNG